MTSNNQRLDADSSSLESDLELAYNEAASAIKKARTLLITSGAGMGVDSGLPDFRGDSGFWNAYPVYRELGLRFMEMATPRHFGEDPAFGWGFYGHRTNLYRETIPHNGFALLKKWIEKFELSWFSVTSNVDGQFQKAGFDENFIEEVHGSIHHLQCLKPCKADIWINDKEYDIDMDTMRCKTIPTCINCGGVARPNVLMFADFWFIPVRSNHQNKRFERYIQECPSPVVVVEIGAGKTIPTIRWTSENLGRKIGATVIRINPREPKIDSPHISIPANAELALSKIDQLLNS